MRFSIELKFLTLTTSTKVPSRPRHGILSLIQIERPPVSVTLCTPGSRRINFRMGQHARSSIVVVVGLAVPCVRAHANGNMAVWPTRRSRAHTTGSGRPSPLAVRSSGRHLVAPPTPPTLRAHRQPRRRRRQSRPARRIHVRGIRALHSPRVHIVAAGQPNQRHVQERHGGAAAPQRKRRGGHV